MTLIRAIPRNSRDEIRVAILPAEKPHHPAVEVRIFAPNRAAMRPDDLAPTSRAVAVRPDVAEAVAAAMIEAARVAKNGGR